MRLIPTLLCLAIILLPPAPGAARGEEPKRPTDAGGDPLPAGAVARLGTLRLRHHNWKSAAFSHDGKVLASGGWDGTVWLWDTATGKELVSFRKETVQQPKLREPVEHLAFSPDGKTLAAGCVAGNNDVRLYDLGTGKERGRLAGHAAKVRVLAFSPDGKLLASGSEDTTVLVWEMTSPDKPRP
jgi:WD40 repeat protein